MNKSFPRSPQGIYILIFRLVSSSCSCEKYSASVTTGWAGGCWGADLANIHRSLLSIIFHSNNSKISHFQISTLAVSLDRYRATLGPWDVIYFLEAMTNSFQTSISKVNLSKVYFCKVCPAYASCKLFDFIPSDTTFSSQL